MKDAKCTEFKCPCCNRDNLNLVGDFNAGSRSMPHVFYEDAVGRGLQGPIYGFVEDHYSLVQWQCNSCGARSPRMESQEAAMEVWTHPNGQVMP
jgi:hypothetical protein